MNRSEVIPGPAAACRRLDDFVNLAGPELGRWIIEVADRLATRGRCQRTLERALRSARPNRRSRR